ncbi:MAG TPA: hypothetical protein VHX11_04430 [Acidobacteriaceae bacterium]|nr:hypothetical protein [Acidobacteriaceae bacterium]
MKLSRLLAFLPALLPVVLYASTTTSSGTSTDPLNLQPAVRQAYQQFYILDYDGALAQFEKIEAAHPDDPIAADYLLDTVLFRELWRLDLLDTTFYAHDGFLTGKHTLPDVDAATRAQIDMLTQKVTSLADDRLKKDPNDTDALYARGWARSLNAVYMALINRSFIPALRLALEARADNQKVLDLDPRYVDAKMVLGVHQYVVGSLPLAFKIVAGVAGIRGSKEKGLTDLRDAGAHGVITGVESSTALALFLRREAQYGDAITVMTSLKQEYPRDFLFSLEVANLTKDQGDGQQAIEAYRALIDRAKRPGYFPSVHLELAWYGLAEALRGQRDYLGAANAYSLAAVQPTSSAEVKGRCELNAGEMFDLLDRRREAEAHYQVVLASNAGSSQADSARKYLKSPFTGN